MPVELTGLVTVVRGTKKLQEIRTYPSYRSLMGKTTTPLPDNYEPPNDIPHS